MFSFEDDSYVEKWALEPKLHKYEKIIIERFFDKISNILVVGCGTGRDSVPLAHMGHKVIALDISKKMIKKAKKLFVHEQNLLFIVGDADKLAINNELFSYCIISNNSINLVEKSENVIRESYRILKRNGLLTFTMHNPYSPHIWKNKKRIKGMYFHKPLKIKKELRNAGFKEINIYSSRSLQNSNSILSKFPFSLFHGILIYVCKK